MTMTYKTNRKIVNSVAQTAILYNILLQQFYTFEQLSVKL